MGVPETDPLSQLSLPPGFRFFPTDEELMVQYLCRKVAGKHFSLPIIGEIDLYKFDPWVLPSKAIFGEKEWYFFSPRDRKYPNGSRPNRVAGSGYWKATGTDKAIMTEGRKVGIKKALVFYIGKAPKGTKTNWIMHEYRLIENSRRTGSTKLDDWVLCRIYKKNSGGQRFNSGVAPEQSQVSTSTSSSSHVDDALESRPEVKDEFFDLPRMNSLKTALLNEENEKLCYQNLGSGNFDWASLLGLNTAPEQSQTQGMMGNYGNESYVPSVPALWSPEKFGNAAAATEEEVQSRNSAAAQQSWNVMSQNSANSVDPYGLRYPNQFGGFGFRQ